MCRRLQSDERGAQCLARSSDAFLLVNIFLQLPPGSIYVRVLDRKLRMRRKLGALRVNLARLADGSYELLFRA